MPLEQRFFNINSTDAIDGIIIGGLNSFNLINTISYGYLSKYSNFISIELDDEVSFNLNIKSKIAKAYDAPFPSSKFKTKIAEILKSEGYIIDYEVKSEQNNKSYLKISLKYSSGNPVISSIERVSKPGRRIFSSADSLPKINNGLGIAILSTPKGVMTDIDARKQKVGGEIICKVF